MSIIDYVLIYYGGHTRNHTFYILRFPGIGKCQRGAIAIQIIFSLQCLHIEQMSGKRLVTDSWRSVCWCGTFSPQGVASVVPSVLRSDLIDRIGIVRAFITLIDNSSLV